MILKEKIESLFDENKTNYSKEDLSIFYEFKENLNAGNIRAAEKVDGIWKVNIWIKKGILLGFKMGKLVEMPISENKSFFDKDTYPERKFSTSDGIRVVPGGSSVRDGAYVSKGVTIMPPAYINVGAYVGQGSMIDSHALVGSCAQIGRGVHLSASAQIGGVLEPIGANPVIIEDNVFVGGNSGINEGVIVKKRAIIAAGTIITAGTPIFDATKNEFLPKEGRAAIIPEGAVIVSGARRLKSNEDFSLYCPIIIKYRDDKSDASTTLEELLR